VHLSGVVLAGGQSRRMGYDKSRLILGGEALIERVLRTLGALCDDLIIVTNAPASFNNMSVRLVADAIPGGGALSGLHAGLTAARHEFAIVVACDMPFLNAKFLQHMAHLAPGYDVVVPRWHSGYEPLHAIYARRCVTAIEPILRSGGGRIVEFYAHVNVRCIEPEQVASFDPEGWMFFNINSPEDLRRAQTMLAAQGS